MFLIFPTGSDEPVERWPIANWVLIGLNVVFFGLTIGSLEGAEPDVPSDLLMQLAVVPAQLSVISLLTYQFLHTGIFHLLMNMLFLYTFGNNINARMGHFRFVVCYLLMGVIAGLTHYAMDLHSDVPMIGASGAICGLTALYVLWYPLGRIQIAYFLLIMLVVKTGTFMVTSRWVVLIWFVLDLVGAFLTGSGSEVAYGAHLGGYLSGSIAAGLLLFTGWIASDGCDLFSIVRHGIPRHERSDPPPPMPLPVKPMSAQTRDFAKEFRAALVLEDRLVLTEAYGTYLEMKTIDPVELSLEKRVLKEFLRHKDYSLVQKALDRLIEHYPDDPDQPLWRYHTAMIQADHENQPGRAVRLLESLVAEYPDWDRRDDAVNALEQLRRG